MRARVRTANYAKAQGRPSGWNTKRAAAAPPAPRRLELGQSVNRNSWGLALIVSPSWRAVGRVLAASSCLCASGPAAEGQKLGILGRFGPKSVIKVTPSKKKVSATNGPTMRSIAVFGPRMTLFQIFLQILYTHARICAHIHMRAENFSQNLSKSVSQSTKTALYCVLLGFSADTFFF